VRLIESINRAPLTPFRFQQWTGKRLTCSYGWSYDFEYGRFVPTDPLPDWLVPLRNRAARFAGLDADSLAQALLIRYDPGARIGWHKDRPAFEA
jgi:alkylated DNA repair dioxygenase AlkB